MQSKTVSLIEALTNVGIGFFIAFFGALVIYPFVGMQSPIGTYFEVTVYFTVLSILRAYFVRRFFNGPFHVFLMRYKNADKN